MNRFLILLGGELVRTPRLERQMEGARVIAADAGIGHAGTLGVIPELWVGDFDSVSEGLVEAWQAIPRETFPVEKDRTDGELAAAAAIARGATSLVLAGAFGGARADHAFLHLALAIRLAEQGFQAIVTDGRQEGRPLLMGAAGFDYAPGTLFSISAFSDLTGLSVAGARWPLDRVAVPFGSSLTLSNIVAGELRITLEKGRAMLIAHPFPGTTF